MSQSDKYAQNRPLIFFSAQGEQPVQAHILDRSNCAGACPQPATPLPLADCLSALQREPARPYSRRPEAYRARRGEMTCVLGVGSRGPAVLDDDALQVLDFFDQPHAACDVRRQFAAWPAETLDAYLATLISIGYLAPAEGKSVVGASVVEGRRSLVAWLHVTDGCPLACKYCYVRAMRERRAGELSPRQMSVETAKRAVDDLFHSAQLHGHDEVYLKFSGGEPLSHMPALVAAQQRAETRSEHTGLVLRSAVLTCGIGIDPSQIDWLCQHGMRVTISLDGLGPAHDAQRPYDGNTDRSPSTQVLETLRAFQDAGMRPNASITVTAQNVDALPETVRYLRRHDVPFNLNLVRPPAGGAVGDEVWKQMRPATEALKRALDGMFDVLEADIPRYSLLGGAVDLLDLRAPHVHACQAGRDYVVVDCDGRVLPCHMHLGQEGELCPAGDVLARNGAGEFPNPNVNERAGCRDCVWKYYCSGGCPVHAQQAHGTAGSPSPYCDVYRMVMPRVLQLEASRLMAYEDPWVCHVQERVHTEESHVPVH